MRFGTTRRNLLAGLATLSLSGSGRGVVGSAEATSEARARQSGAFDPAVHGFGFRNWSTLETTYPEHDHDLVDEEQVRRVIGQRWEEPAKRSLDVNVLKLPNSLLDAIAKQVYVSVNQQSGTNGHCYGMVFTAQQYYENPDSVPLGRDVASEFAHPEAPVDDPGTGPVAREIDLYHLTQFLNLNSWVGRRALVRPRWIDYERQLDRLAAVVDEFGTAGLTVFETATRKSHQVLVYDYERGPDATRLFVYDPNYPARQYAAVGDPLTIDVDTSGDRPTVEPFRDTYDGFVFNRQDRAIAAQTAARPGSFAVDPDGNVREDLFSLALFLVDSAAVSLTVVGPDDRPLRRDTATYADRARSEYSRMRYRYGFSPGKYAVRVVGERDAEYTLRALVADAEAKRLDARPTASIRAGEVHRYVAEVPESGAGSLERDSGGSSWSGKLGAAGVGAGVAGLAAGAFARLRGGSEERGDGDGVGGA